MIFLLVAIALLMLVAAPLAIGARSRAVIVAPESLSDRQIDATIELTRRIMRRARPGTTTWQRAAARHKAAVDERLRRSGNQPFDEIEIAER